MGRRERSFLVSTFSRKEKKSILVAAARRFLVLLVLASAATVVGSFVFGLLAGASLGRAISVGFYLVGSFLLVGGFFTGNRGPLRLKSDEAGLPFWGSRAVRWATVEEREDAINTSAIYVALGFVLILAGVAVDTRYQIFF